MFFHILAIQRQVNWIFCNVGFAEIPLDGIDSVDPITGACKKNAVLPLVVSGVSVVLCPNASSGTYRLKLIDSLR